VLEALALLDPRYRQPWQLRSLLTALGNAPGEKAEELLGQLAERDPRLYEEHYWLAALVGRDTETSARTLIDLIARGKLAGSAISAYKLSMDLAGLIRRHPAVRGELFQRYESLTQGGGGDRSVIERAMAELSDVDCLEALIQGYARTGRQFDGTLHKLIEGVVLGEEPSPDFEGAYELHAVDATVVRRRLFAIVESGGAVAGIAEACLTAIDELRDEYGRVDSEPRHPDITSRRPWPTVAGFVSTG
jgi:hypothetical protein